MVVDTGTGSGIYEKKIQKVIVGFRAKYKLGCQRGACSSKGKGKDKGTKDPSYLARALLTI